MTPQGGRVAFDISTFDFGGQDYLLLGYPLRRNGPAFAELTAAELLVAEGTVAGLSMRALAQRRGVSERTIANQLARVYRKLGIASRYELSALAAGASDRRG